MANSLSEDALKESKCYDYSIQQMQNEKNVLILMCEDENCSNKLNQILHSNPFDLKVSLEDKTNNYILTFEFIETDLVFQLKTGRNEQTYPPVTWLKEGKVKFITTGVWGKNSEKGRMCEIHSNLMRFGELNIAEAFQQAIAVQFYSNPDETKVPAVGLIYKDWDHIFSSEANEAYNLLESHCKSMPKLEIKINENQTVNLRIWDILIDLDIRMTNLPYSKEELENFVSQSKPEQSLAFVLVFPSIGNGNLGIAASKQENFEIITLHGYVLKKVTST